MADNAKIIWDFLMKQIGNAYGVAGLMGNLYAESGLLANNLQNSHSKRFGMTDAEYTKAVDNGSYANFVKDSAGYGLAQWTYWSRKQALKKYADSKGKSIGDLTMQLEFLMKELSGSYPAVLATLKKATSILEASNAVLLKFERPADQSVKVQNKRASYGTLYFDQYANKKMVSVKVSVLKKGCKGEDVKALQGILNALGYPCGNADGSFGSNTEAAVKKFQAAHNLTADGSVGANTWAELLN
jgi:murein L,D-transpeptidase YcbB/YkuD